MYVKHGYENTLDVFGSLVSEVYMVPWTRIAPYIMGTLTAICLEKNGGTLKLTEVVLRFRKL
jgi:hypothetical protein